MSDTETLPFDSNDSSDIRQLSNGSESHPCMRLKLTSDNTTAQAIVETNRFGKLIITMCACNTPFVRQEYTNAEIRAGFFRDSEPELWTRMGEAWTDLLESFPKDATFYGGS